MFAMTTQATASLSEEIERLLWQVANTLTPMAFTTALRDAIGAACFRLHFPASRLGWRRASTRLFGLSVRIPVHDALTKVLARYEVFRQLKAKLPTSPSGAVLLLDVDRLGVLNKVFGYAAGDVFLRSAMLIVSEEAGSLVGRLGGEEFVVFVPDASTVEAIFDRIQARMRTEFSERRAQLVAEFPEFEGKPLLTFSAGAAAVGQGLTVEDVLNRCDEALCEAKKSAGRGCLRWHKWARLAEHS
jgi:diguanylate cyclase (GGDEF)-like protein